jgi:hypothetical protein
MSNQSTLFRPELEKAAVISPCGLYRYTLTRQWHEGPTGNFIMLNPSTADARIDDNTIRRLIGFSRSWGLSGFVVTNLFAYRATQPADMKQAVDPVGPENDRHILEHAKLASLVVVAWGANGTFLDRDKDVLWMLAANEIEPHCISLTKDGHPSHPLRLRSDLKPTRFEMRGPKP